jgi:hypothetical protein
MTVSIRLSVVPAVPLSSQMLIKKVVLNMKIQAITNTKAMMSTKVMIIKTN